MSVSACRLCVSMPSLREPCRSPSWLRDWSDAWTDPRPQDRQPSISLTSPSLAHALAASALCELPACRETVRILLTAIELYMLHADFPVAGDHSVAQCRGTVAALAR